MKSDDDTVLQDCFGVPITFDIQAVKKPLTNHSFDNAMLWECLDKLYELTNHDIKIGLAPGVKGINGNNKADDLASKGSETLTMGLNQHNCIKNLN